MPSVAMKRRAFLAIREVLKARLNEPDEANQHSPEHIGTEADI